MLWQNVHRSVTQIITRLRGQVPPPETCLNNPWHGKMIDLHTHLLPGLDDGAADWIQTLALARMAVDDGISAMVCTPHWVYGLYENTREMVLRLWGALQQKLHQEGIPLDVYPGCEIRLEPDVPAHLASGELVTFNDNGRYALIELSGDFIPSYVEESFRQLFDQGITPIISHPERYPALQRDPSRLYAWVESGVLCQVTAASLSGRFGPLVRRFTLMLVEHKLAHVMATDAHGLRVRAPHLSNAVIELQTIVGPELTEQMVVTTPRAILAGAEVSVPRPLPLSNKSWPLSTMQKLFPSFS